MSRYHRLCMAALVMLLLTGCARDPIPTMPPATQPPETTQTIPITTEPRPTEPSVTEPAPSEATEATFPEITETTAPTAPAETAPPVTEPPMTEAPETVPEPSGWVEVDGARYYRDEDGSFHTGFLTIGSDRYWFHPDGTMARGKVAVSDTETRYFASSGKEVILVNPWNFVPEDYDPTIVTCYGMKMAEVCKSPLKKMLADCEAAGFDAVVVSAYRTHDYQEGLFQRRIQRFLDQGLSQEDAEREAAKRVAFPGTSEHELGLALDIVDERYQELNDKQETMPAQKWLMANSWRYGFILRYPSGTTEHTGIIYEPWHYRYVGEELAKELYDSGLCLEAYLDRLTE